MVAISLVFDADRRERLPMPMPMPIAERARTLADETVTLGADSDSRFRRFFVGEQIDPVEAAIGAAAE